MAIWALFERMRPSIRSKRYLSLWFTNMAVMLATLIAAVTAGGVLGYLIVLAVKAYGATLVVIGIALVWLVVLSGAIAAMLAEEKLDKEEDTQRDVLRKLSRPDDR